MIFTPIPASQVDEYWRVVAPLIESACARDLGGETSAHIYEQVKKGQGWVLTLLDGGVAVFERSGEYLHMVTLAGTGMIANARPIIEAWAHLASFVGCSKLSLIGRKGWRRVLAPYGFKLNGEVLEKS